MLKGRGNPEALRISAANALYMVRREGKGKSFFPKAAWDALRIVWQERDFGRLHSAVGEVLKLQGA